MMAAGQHLRVMCDLSHICCGDHYSSAYCDTNVVCADGVIRYIFIHFVVLDCPIWNRCRHNRSVLTIILPFLHEYSALLDVERDLTILLPDVAVRDVNEKLRSAFSLGTDRNNHLCAQTRVAAVKDVSGFSYLLQEDVIPCNTCGKSVKRSSLNSHMKTHSPRTYSCQICNKTFIRKSQLKAHALNHSGNLPYQCTICDKAFASQQGLKTHNLSHQGEPAHICDICNKGFYTKFKLKQHLDVHFRVRNFPCTKCGKMFTRKDNMKAHMLKLCKINNLQS